MTVKTNLEQTIAEAQSLSGQLKQHALDTDHEAVSEMFDSMSKQIDEMLPHLKGRLSHIQDEEPQYQ